MDVGKGNRVRRPCALGHPGLGVVASTAEIAVERYGDFLGMTLTLEGGCPVFELAEHHGRGLHLVRFTIPVYRPMPALLLEQDQAPEISRRFKGRETPVNSR